MATIIPSVGLALSFTCCNTAFPRSGSVLVCFAIFAVYINHFVKNEHDVTKSVIQAITKVGQNAAEIQRNMNPAISDPTLRAQSAANMSGILEKAKEEVPKLEKINSNIVRIEFISGFIGTLIWGFGDILFVTS